MDRRVQFSLLAIALLLGSALAVYVIAQAAPLDPLAQFRTADGRITIPGGRLTHELQQLLFPPKQPDTYWTYAPDHSAYPTLNVIGTEHPIHRSAPTVSNPLRPVGTDSLKAFWEALLRLPKQIVSFFSMDASAAGCTGTGSCFWVGGTGNFTDTTKWATTSGGATTGGLPNSTDAVTFDASSGAGTATQNNASFTSGAVTLTNSSVTVSGSSNTWHVGGNWSDANNHFSLSTSTIQMDATGTFIAPDTNGGDYLYNWNITAGTTTVAIPAGGNKIFAVSRAFTVNGGTITDNGTGQKIFFHNNGGSTTFFTYTSGSIVATSAGLLTLEFDNSAGGTLTILFPGGTYSHVSLIFESRFATVPTYQLQAGITSTDGAFILGTDAAAIVDTQTFNMTIGGISVLGTAIHQLRSTSGTWSTLGLSSSGNTNWYWTAGTISVTDTGSCGGGCTYRNGSANNNWNGSAATYTYGGSTTGVWRPGSFTTATEWGTLIMDTTAGNTLTMETNGMRVGALTVRNTHATTTTLNTSGSNFSITATSITIAAGGTITANASTITVSGNWDTTANSATFTQGTSTVVLSATGTLGVNSGSARTFYNINVAAAGTTTTISGGGALVIYTNVGTLGTGNLSSGTFYNNGSNANPFVNAGATITSTLTFDRTTPFTMNMPATTTSGACNFQGAAATYTATLTGALSCGALNVFASSGSTTVTLSTSGTNYSLTATSLTLGSGSNHGAVSANGSTVTVTGNVSISTSGSYMTLGTSTWSVSGTWTNSSTSASWSSGTSSVTFTSATGGTMTFAGANLAVDEFNNVTFASSAAGSQTFTMASRGIKVTNVLNIDSTTVLNKATFTLAAGALRLFIGSTNALTSTSGAVTIGNSGVDIQGTGSYIRFGSEAWTVSGFWSNVSTSGSWLAGSGTVTFNSASGATMNFAGVAFDEFNNVVFTSSGATPKTFTMAGNGLRYLGNLTVQDTVGTTTLVTAGFAISNFSSGAFIIGNGGIVTATTSSVFVGNVQMTGGTSGVITMTSGSWQVYVTAGWDTTGVGSTFTAGTGTVTLGNASGTPNVKHLAGQGFYNLTVDTGTTATALSNLEAANNILISSTGTLAAGNPSFDLRFVALTITGSLSMDGKTASNMTFTTNSGNISLTTWNAYSTSDIPQTEWVMDPSAAGATVTITQSGLTAGHLYSLLRDGIVENSALANGSGVATFSLTGGWSSHTMDIATTGGGGGGGGSDNIVVTSDGKSTFYFTVNPKSGPMMLSVDWDFGDGQTGTSNGVDPIAHTYGAIGAYMVGAVVHYSDGSTSSLSADITVTDLSVAAATIPWMMIGWVVLAIGIGMFLLTRRLRWLAIILMALGIAIVLFAAGFLTPP